MSEILKYKGRLGEKELEAKQLRLGAEGLVTSLRDTLDPFEPVEDLNIELAAQEMENLKKVIPELMDTLHDITAIKKALGR